MVCVAVSAFSCYYWHCHCINSFIWSTRTTTRPSLAAASINVIRHFTVSVYCTISKLKPYRQVCEVALAGSTRVLHGIHNLRCFTQLLAALTSGSEAATQLWLVWGWRQNKYTTVMFSRCTVAQFMILNVEHFAITETEEQLTAGSLPINWLWQNIVVYFILRAI